MVECGGGYSSGYSSYSEPSCPLFSSYDSLSGSCQCDPGYVVDTDGTCTDANIVCHEKLGYSSRYDSISNSCKCNYGYSIDSSGKCTDLDSQCHDQVGIMSSYDSVTDTCKCDPGYIISGGQCTNANLHCSLTLGYGSEYDQSTHSCVCSIGYRMNSDGSSCVTNEKYCSDQYGFNSEYNSLSDTCECQSGYEYDGSSCVPVPEPVAPSVAIPNSPVVKPPNPPVVPVNTVIPKTTPKLPDALTASSAPESDHFMATSTATTTLSGTTTKSTESHQDGLFQDILNITSFGFWATLISHFF